MPECRFSLTRIFPFKDKITDSVFIRENVDQRKPLFCHTLRSVCLICYTAPGYKKSNRESKSRLIITL